MQTRAYLQTQSMNRVAHRAGASNRARGAVESRKQTVARGGYFASSISAQLPADQGVPIVEHTVPLRISDFRGALRRGDNVGEHHGGQHSIGLMHMPLAGYKFLDLVCDKILRVAIDYGVVGALHSDKPRTGYVFGDITSTTGRHQRVADSMKNQRGRLDSREYVPNVQVIVEPHQCANGARTGGGAFPSARGPARRIAVPTAGGIGREQNSHAPNRSPHQ